MNTRQAPPSGLVNFLFSGIAGIVTQCIYYPLGNAYARIEDYKGKVTYQSDFQKIIFPDNHHQPFLSRAASLYEGFLLTEMHKIAGKSFKYGFQPMVNGGLEKNLRDENNPRKKIFIAAASGTITSLIQIGLFYPLDTIKAKRQDANKLPVRDIIKAQRLNLYNAVELAVASKLVGSFVLFGSTSAVLYSMGVKNEKEAHLWQYGLASTIGAAADAVFTNPMAVTKTRIQQSAVKISPWGMFKQISHAEGPKGLYKGAFFNIVTAVPKKALPMVITESLIARWNKK